MPRPRTRRSEFPGGYFALPKAITSHPDFRTLPPACIKVLCALGDQYTGKNNGRLAATRKLMHQEWGGMSHTTLYAALAELKRRELVHCTRPHIKTASGAKPALYALSWLPVDDCHEDVEPEAKARRTLR